MQKRNIGHVSVSVVGMGCNNFGRRLDAAATAEVVNAAIANGVDFFDTADVYGEGLSEEYLGRALAGRRGDVVIATKFGMEMPDGKGGSPRWVRRAAEDSLRRLGTDFIDLYQMHRPDDEVPIAETLAAMATLVDEGKVRAVGCSNVSVPQIEEALGIAAGAELPSWVSVQNHYSLLHLEPEEDGVLDACARLGLGFLPFFPLASGMLTGKYRAGAEPDPDTRLGSVPPERAERFLNERNMAASAGLARFAADRGHTLLELAFGYLLATEAVSSVIAGATRADQVAANASAGTAWVLTQEEAAEARAIAFDRPGGRAAELPEQEAGSR